MDLWPPHANMHACVHTQIHTHQCKFFLHTLTFSQYSTRVIISSLLGSTSHPSSIPIAVINVSIGQV